MRPFSLLAVVTLLVLYGLINVAAAAFEFWRPAGTIGLATDYDLTIRMVSPGGPAALAGILPGDRIQLATVPFAERRYVAGVAVAPHVGTLIHFTLIHVDQTRIIQLKAVPQQITGADRSSLLLQCLASIVFIAVGATLIVLRPTRATWGFGLYCLILLPTSGYPFRLPSAVTAMIALGLFDVLQNLGVVGLLVFALNFPRPFDTRWRRAVRRSVPLIFVGLAAMTLYPDVSNLFFGMGAELENRVLQIVFGVVFGLAMYILCDTYRRIALDERERLRWVLIGFGVGLLTNYVGNTVLYSSLLPIEPPVWLINWLISLNVLLPVTVGYAVVRHRVLDINVVVGRALVYATLTTILAGCFGLLDWFFGTVLQDFRLTRIVEAGISIAIAFTFDELHKRIERAVEAIFFRKRREAESRVDRLIHDLPQARSIAVIEAAVIRDVADAFELSSAAMFRQSDSAPGFRRTASFGWDTAACESINDTDLLVLELRSEKRCLKLADVPLRRGGLPQGDHAPLVAVPMHSRDDMVGVLLYGPHVDGADLDATELVQLERLAHSASVGLDELAAERLRAENQSQAATIERLKARVDELSAAR